MSRPDAFPKLTFTLQHDGPIPLGDFTDALSRVSGRYGRFTRARGTEEDAKLYIAQIRQGSIAIDLVSTGMAAMAVMDAVGGVNAVIEFGKNVASLLKRFRDEEVTPDDVSMTDCDDVRAMVRPVLTTEGGGLTIAVNGDNNVVQPILLNLDRHGASLIDNRAATIRDALGSQAEQILTEVFFVWDQIRDAPAVEQGKRSPDRGIIAIVDGRPRQVTFADPAAKEAMYHGINPFEVGFIVDAKLMVGPQGPAGYRILRVHDVVERGPPA